MLYADIIGLVQLALALEPVILLTSLNNKFKIYIRIIYQLLQIFEFRGKYVYVFVQRISVIFLHFTPIFVNLFAGWRELWPSLRN